MNVTGFTIIFDVIIYSHRAATTRIIEKKKEENGVYKSTILFVSSHDYSKIEYTGAKEIKYKGKMYDVFQKVVKSGGTYFYCYNDEPEDQIINWFASFFNLKTDKDNRSQSSGAEYVLNNLAKYFLSPESIGCSTPSGRFSYAVNQEYLSVQLPHCVQTPPPELRLRIS